VFQIGEWLVPPSSHSTTKSKQHLHQSLIIFETQLRFETHSTKKNKQRQNTTMGPLKRLQMISLSLTLLIRISSSFTTMNAPIRAAAFNKRPRVARTECYFIMDFSAAESFHSLLDSQSSMAATTGSSTVLSPDIEAEVLTDMSYMVMDFSSFFGPSKPLRQWCSVLGRILIIGSDFLPDQNVHPEELVFQLFLLAINLKDVLKTDLSSRMTF
jgi:hypothetical protein